jgi:hypothetical protein
LQLIVVVGRIVLCRSAAARLDGEHRTLSWEGLLMPSGLQLYPALEPSVFFVDIDQQIAIHGVGFMPSKHHDGTYKIKVEFQKYDGDFVDPGVFTNVVGVTDTVIIVELGKGTFPLHPQPIDDASLLVFVETSLHVIVTNPDGDSIARAYPMTFDSIQSY